nr:hypothetical protein BHI3_13010 [Bacteriovorax sp. HI3]
MRNVVFKHLGKELTTNKYSYISILICYMALGLIVYLQLSHFYTVGLFAFYLFTLIYYLRNKKTLLLREEVLLLPLSRLELSFFSLFHASCTGALVFLMFLILDTVEGEVNLKGIAFYPLIILLLASNLFTRPLKKFRKRFLIKLGRIYIVGFLSIILIVFVSDFSKANGIFYYYLAIAIMGLLIISYYSLIVMKDDIFNEHLNYKRQLFFPVFDVPLILLVFFMAFIFTRHHFTNEKVKTVVEYKNPVNVND